MKTSRACLLAALAAASLVSVTDADHSLAARGAAVGVAAEQLTAAAEAAVRLL